MKERQTIKAALQRLGMEAENGRTISFYAERTFDAPASAIWDEFRALDKWKTWAPPFVEPIRWLEKRDMEFGARFEQVRHFGFPIGRQATVDTVREVVPGTELAWWDSSGGGMRNCCVWQFETLPDGRTRVAVAEVFVGFVAWIASFKHKRIQRRYQALLERFASHVEKTRS